MNDTLKKVLTAFKILMSLIYIAIGLVFLFSNQGFAGVIPVQYMPVAGLLLIAYGIFRGYRAYFVEKSL